MEFLKEKDDDGGPTIALSDKEINNMFELAKLSQNDIFFDLGSGDGEIVRQAIKKRKVKESHGIESDIKRFLHSIESTRDEFSNKKLENIELWRAYYYDFDFSDASVVYHGIYDYGSKKLIDMFNKIHKNKKKSFKIVKRDLPLFPYGPIDAYRDDKESWFFLMRTPLSKHKIKNKNLWAELVLNKKGKTIYDVYKYYRKKLIKRFNNEGSSLQDAKKEADSCVKMFQRLVNKK